MSDERLRLFIALTLEHSSRREINNLQGKMWGENKRGLTDSENFHLTLAFLGETDSKRVEEICWAMEKTRMQPPELVFDRIGVFKQNNGEIWWLGIKENKLLEKLQSSLVDNLMYKGFRLEERKFVPHLTLARKNRPNFIPKNGRLEKVIHSYVPFVSLMRSDQINGKRVYTQIFNT